MDFVKIIRLKQDMTDPKDFGPALDRKRTIYAKHVEELVREFNIPP